ncbi:DedA family protein [Altererythrobacter sp. HHU K3-1]|uniref:DedA family protein n=2 Tax=Qipengyuania atrilutea TaxID=2744473 RepID=A0A850H677_9SPHN|nr:DedA family protein [Actirhodobacter atriluteus]
MEKAAHKHAVWWLAFFCFIEASFFPIPPHPLLGLMCLAKPKKALWFAFVATAASVIGGLFGYAIGYFLFESVGVPLLTAIGLIDALPQAQCTFDELGVYAVIIAAATPVPFKLLTITAGFLSMDLIPFILASIAGRALIFMTVGILFQIFGRPIKALIDKYLGLLTTLFVVLVVGGILAMTLMGGDGEAADEECATAATEQVV